MEGIHSLIRKIQWYHDKHGWAKLIALSATKLRDHINKKEWTVKHKIGGEFSYQFDSNTRFKSNRGHF